MSNFLLSERTNSSADLQLWGSQLKPNFSESLNAVSGKENLFVSMDNHACSSVSSSIGARPFQPVNRDIELSGQPRLKGVSMNQEDTVRKLDDVIEEIESEITMLRSRLEELRFKKAMSGVVFEKQNRIVSPNDKENAVSIKRRGMSLGPSEIARAAKSSKFGRGEIDSPVLKFEKRNGNVPPKVKEKTVWMRPRGVSLGPSEIVRAAKSSKFGREEIDSPVLKFEKQNGNDPSKVKEKTVWMRPRGMSLGQSEIVGAAKSSNFGREVIVSPINGNAPPKVKEKTVCLRRRGMSLGPSEIVDAVKSSKFGREEIGSPVLKFEKQEGNVPSKVKEKTAWMRPRGMSLGPSEIVGAAKSSKFGREVVASPVLKFVKRNGNVPPKVREKTEWLRRRGMSLGPSEIVGAAKSSKFGWGEIASSVLSRRNSCFFKLENTEKENAVECSSGNSVQGKKLSEKSALASNSKLLKPARVVASRYNQSTSQNLSLEEDDVKNSAVKKRWEIPNEIVLHCSAEDEDPVVVMSQILPRIRTVRSMNESPRDSGPAKRVADLIGKKSFFADVEETERSVSQVLRYDDE